MSIVYPIDLAVFMVQHLPGNLTRHAQFGQLAAHRSTDIVDAPAGDPGEPIKLLLGLVKIAAGRVAAGRGEHISIGAEIAALA